MRESNSLSMRERVGHQVLRSEDPVVVWASWRILGIETQLKMKEKHAGWDRFIWQTLLVCHKLGFVCQIEHKLFSTWYSWRFDPHKAAQQLGDGAIPLSLQDSLTRSEVSLKRCARGMVLLWILDALVLGSDVMGVWDLGDMVSTVIAVIGVLWSIYLLFELIEAVPCYCKARYGVKQLQRAMARQSSAWRS